MSDTLLFLRSLIARPGNVGAIAPSGPALACAMAALSLGKHVFCEKPLVHTVEEARRIAAGFDVLNLALGRAGSDYIWW